MPNKYIDIYPDCSGNSKFGIAITILDGESEHFYSLKTNNHLISRDLGSKETLKAGTFLGEGYAVVKALELVEDKNSHIRLFTDCMLSFHTFNDLFSKSKRKKDLRTIHLLSKFSKLATEFKSVEVCWIKGHSGTFGNSISDTISRKTFKTKSDKHLGKIQKIDITSDIFTFKSETSHFEARSLHKLNFGI